MARVFVSRLKHAPPQNHRHHGDPLRREWITRPGIHWPTVA